MKKLITSCVLLIVSTLIGGCAHTSMTSYIDPSYRASSFKRVLVIANISDLQWRQKVESRLVEAFRDQGIFAMESLDLFPPTRNLSDEQKVKLLLQNHIDSYIVVSVGDAGAQQVYIPPTGSSTKTSGSVSVYGDNATYQEKSTTTTYGGYTVSKPWAQFDAKLFDASNGQNAWMASAFTGGNAYANYNTVVNSFCDKTVEQLVNDGVVQEAIK